MQKYKQTGNITLTKWDQATKKIINTKGVIPVPPNYKQAFKVDFANYTGDSTKATDASKWVFLKSGADAAHHLSQYADTLTSAQMSKLATPVTAIENEQQLPKGFALIQNYPNPFNPGTIIEFHLPKVTTVMVKLFDIRGAEVKTLVANQSLSAGVHKVYMKAHELPSGVYPYRLITPEFTQTKKMVLAK